MARTAWLARCQLGDNLWSLFDSRSSGFSNSFKNSLRVTFPPTSTRSRTHLHMSSNSISFSPISLPRLQCRDPPATRSLQSERCEELNLTGAKTIKPEQRLVKQFFFTY